MTLICFVYVCVYSQCCTLFLHITNGVGLLFLYSFLRGVWRCPISMSEADKSSRLSFYILIKHNAFSGDCGHKLKKWEHLRLFLSELLQV